MLAGLQAGVPVRGPVFYPRDVRAHTLSSPRVYKPQRPLIPAPRSPLPCFVTLFSL